MDEFKTKEGGRIARAEEGEILVGANPFGICCSECGNVMKMAWWITADCDSGEEHGLGVELTNDDEESARYREAFQILSPVVLYETIVRARQIVADYKLTMESLMDQLKAVQEAVQNEIEAQRFEACQSQHLLLAEQVLTALLPEGKKRKGLILMPGGRG